MFNFIKDEKLTEDQIKRLKELGVYDEEEVDRLSDLGLEDHEIEEVLKGNQSEFDFNDDPNDEFEDDDYYMEDDI